MHPTSNHLSWPETQDGLEPIPARKEAQGWETSRMGC